MHLSYRRELEIAVAYGGAAKENPSSNATSRRHREVTMPRISAYAIKD